MLFWLTLICAFLAGLFVYFLNPEASLEGIPHSAIACGFVALMALLYTLSSKPRVRDDSRSRRIALPIALISALIAGLYYFAPRSPTLEALVTSALRSDPEFEADGRDGAKAVRIRRNTSSKFVARGEINSSAAEFLIDTGAAIVLLRQSDAERAGIDISALTYSVPVETANGTTYAAPVRIRSLAVGPIHVEGLEALVAARGSLNENLLGISFLRRLRSYELAGDFITLRE